MGPKTKGKGTKKARREAVGPSASTESTQPKVAKVRQQQEVFLSATEVTDERSTEDDMASDDGTRSHGLVAPQGSQRSSPTGFVQPMKKSWLISSETITDAYKRH